MPNVSETILVVRLLVMDSVIEETNIQGINEYARFCILLITFSSKGVSQSQNALQSEDAKHKTTITIASPPAKRSNIHAMLRMVKFMSFSFSVTETL